MSIRSIFKFKNSLILDEKIGKPEYKLSMNENSLDEKSLNTYFWVESIT